MTKGKSRLVNTRFWDDNYTSNLDPIEKLLFLYFLTNPLTNLIGIYEIEIRRIAFDTGIDKDMVIKILDRFKADKKIFYEGGFIIIPNFIKFQNENSPKIKTAINTQIAELPENIKKFISVSEYGIYTLSHINTNINTNINSNSNSNSNFKKEQKIKPEKSPVLKITEIKKNNLQNELRKIFENYYLQNKKINYYYDAKSSGALKQIINKLKSVSSPEKQSDECIKKSFVYILKNISDVWILDNLDLSILNSKFNQIISKLKNGKITNTNGKSNNRNFAEYSETVKSELLRQ